MIELEPVPYTLPEVYKLPAPGSGLTEFDNESDFQWILPLDFRAKAGKLKRGFLKSITSRRD